MPVTPIEPITGITAYGCARDEAALFEVLAPRFGVRATVTDAALTEDSVDLAVGPAEDGLRVAHRHQHQHQRVVGHAVG